ncbi:catechol 2,3-dioxygenase-like lactoylglutathione lyase family enzyme [Luteimonas sp. J16]|jgi:catechol 2,3-dioxygenase-like lactoylglutathione lyase family enzyme|uniref:VOC family protein n=1 Tax=unclassified Luteimonas TaxID=2629088 RepID=UPI00047E61C9|nr:MULTISPECIES: VOC family protein [unclassified Luteimonas]TWG92867.1 catechol 2,3-dioxygenase-like lactoylglutathione lyase family enzyme [Luteimonas sp. J16]
MAARIRSLVAFAHVADVARSIRFYADLGFRAARTVPPGGTAPVWAWLESEAARLMLGQASAPVDPSAQAVLFYLYVDDVRASHAALVRLGHAPGPIRHPPHMPGGEFRLEDPDGYVLMLAQADAGANNR